MMRSPKILLLVGLSVAQVTAATWSIIRYERTLATGTLYKISASPYNPADPFLGRYVAIQPAIPVTEPTSAETRRILDTLRGGNGTAFVVLAADGDGFARIVEVLDRQPAAGDYLRVNRARVQPVGTPSPDVQTEYTYEVVPAFDRYYVSEAPAANEQQLGVRVRRDVWTRTWLTVRVRDGIGVIEGLYVDGAPIEEVISSEPPYTPRR